MHGPFMAFLTQQGHCNVTRLDAVLTLSFLQKYIFVQFTRDGFHYKTVTEHFTSVPALSVLYLKAYA